MGAEILDPMLLIGALLGFGLASWLWYGFSWRWYPAPLLLAFGASCLLVSGSGCLLVALLDLVLRCSDLGRNMMWAGLGAASLLSGAFILALSPVLAFWRRAVEAARHEA